MFNQSVSGIQLKDYQLALIQSIFEQWKSHQRVMAQSPMGGDKHRYQKLIGQNHQ